MSQRLNDSELLARRRQMLEQARKGPVADDVLSEIESIAARWSESQDESRQERDRREALARQQMTISPKEVRQREMDRQQSWTPNEWKQHSMSQGIYGQSGSSGSAGLSGTMGSPGMVPNVHMDYMTRQKQIEADLKARVDKELKKPEQGRMPKPPRGPVETAKFDKGPSLLRRIWQALTRDDGLNDYHKTKEIYERRETVRGDARSQVKGGRGPE